MWCGRRWTELTWTISLKKLSAQFLLSAPQDNVWLLVSSAVQILNFVDESYCFYSFESKRAHVPAWFWRLHLQLLRLRCWLGRAPILMKTLRISQQLQAMRTSYKNISTGSIFFSFTDFFSLSLSYEVLFASTTRWGESTKKDYANTDFELVLTEDGDNKALSPKLGEGGNSFAITAKLPQNKVTSPLSFSQVRSRADSLICVALTPNPLPTVDPSAMAAILLHLFIPLRTSHLKCVLWITFFNPFFCDEEIILAQWGLVVCCFAVGGNTCTAQCVPVCVITNPKGRATLPLFWFIFCKKK